MTVGSMRAAAIAAIGAGALVLTSCGAGEADRTDLAGLQTRLAQADLECEGRPGPYRPHGDDLSLGVADPIEALECVTADGTELSASRWERTAEVQAAMTVVESFVCAFGGDVAYVVTGSTLIGLDGDVMTKEDYRTITAVAAALDVSVLEPCGDIDPDRLPDATGRFGAPVDLGDDTTMTVDAPRGGGDDAGPWIEVDVEFVNDSSTTAPLPEVEFVCAGAQRGGGTQADSTLDTFTDVGPGGEVSGTLHLLPTGNERYGDGHDTCAVPAQIVIGGRDGPTLTVPDSVVTEYNRTIVEQPD